MNLDLTETQSLLQETVRGFLESEVPFDRIRELEQEQAMDRILWKSVCEQGWLALPVAEALGGGGGSLVDVGLLVEEFARRAAIVPVLEAVAVGRVLERFGPEERAGALLGDVLSGNVVAVPAVLEASDRFDAVEALVDAEGALTGEKVFVDFGQHATHHLVAARGEGGLGLYWVEASHAAVDVAPLRSIGRTPQARVRYAGVPAERVADGDAVAELIRLGRALAAVQCLGSMQQALDMTVEYAKVREQFGKPIGSFQAVRHHCANMASQVASARALAYEALSALDRGEPADEAAAAAKASASRAAPEVLMLAHQIFGGNGVIEENDLYFFTLRGKERSLAWGSVEECLDVLAAGVDAPVEWL
jgi:alkylation response protein AidB-like acyl-CoA dehydrogenase